MRKIATVLFLVFSFGQGLKGQELTELARSASNDHEHYGWSMAMDENWLVVGTPHSTTNAGQDAGKVVIYQKNGDNWDEFQVLVDADGNTFQNYGFSVDMKSSVLVVGAIGTFQEGPFTGKALVYEFDGTDWQLTNTIQASDAAAGNYFGHSVATNGSRIIVGAIKADGAASASGAVYDFTKVNGTWTFANKLMADDGATHDNFGYSIDINDDNVVVIGSPNQSDFIDKSGAAYVFNTDGAAYTQTAKLKAFARTEKDFLGTSVAINRNDIVAGAFLADGLSNNTGSVYYFRNESDTWKEIQQVVYPGGGLNDYFGKSVAVSDFRLFVGAPKVNIGDKLDVGQSYYYEKEGGLWVLKQVLDDPEGTEHNYFGAAVIVTNLNLAISARMDDVNRADGGTVYAASLPAVVTGLEDDIMLEQAIELKAYPNPAQQHINIRYKLLKSSRVAIEVFDNGGNPIKELLPETIQPAGDQELQWNLSAFDGSRVANGLYFYKLSIDGNVFTRKVIVSR
ncbi:MAG: hypothetical protein Roseis2KO_53500 [Roseivirga sp.]